MNLEKILAVVVLYNKKLNESSTLNSLNQSLNERLDVLIYDNSPEPDIDWNQGDFFNLNLEYYHSSRNAGIAKGYNLALKYAKNYRKDWIILFDHDTQVLPKYIDEINSLELSNFAADIVCLVPRIASSVNNKIISPCLLMAGGFVKPVMESHGLLTGKITSINSASILRVDYVESIGGFNEDYPLDMLDYWFFREIHKDKKRIYLLNADLSHNLSVDDKQNYISADRYRQLLEAEINFYNGDGSISNLCFKLRLTLRTIKFLIARRFSLAKATATKLINI